MTTTTRPEVGQSIDANGVRTNYLEAGSGEGTFVLIHGSGPGVTAHSNWRLVLPALGEDFRVLAPDMVGFGYSDRPEDVRYNVQTWADQTVGFMDAMGIKKAHLVGNSFGGAIALRIATQHPERVDRLVLMGSMGVDFPITEGLDTVWGYEGTINSMRNVLDFFAYPRELVNEELAQVRYKASVEPGFQEAFSAMFPAPRQRWVDAMTTPDEEISKLPHRTLVMHGREDKVIPVSNSYKLEELLDNADLSVFSHTAGTGP
ncbi:MAG TPA: alpha/beta fold hydrolase [Nakamurella sp.]